MDDAELELAEELAALFNGEDMGPHTGMTADELADHLAELDE